MADVPALFDKVVECVLKARDIRALAASARRNAAEAETARLGAAPISAAVFETLAGQFLESADSFDVSAAAWDDLATRYNQSMMERVRAVLLERTAHAAGHCGFRK